MRKVEELSGVCTVERGGTRDRTVVTGVREGYSWRNMPLDGGQQPGACTDSAPGPALLLHDHLRSEQ